MEVLFEKTYPQPAWDKIIEDADNAKNKPQAIAFIEHLEEMRRNAIYEPIPERIEASKKLVQMVQDFSEKYEIDAKAEQDEDRVSIDFFFDACALSKENLHEFVAILDFVDNIMFCATKDDTYEVIILLSYRTHKVIPPKETEQQSL